MKKILLSITFLLCSIGLFAQNNSQKVIGKYLYIDGPGVIIEELRFGAKDDSLTIKNDGHELLAISGSTSSSTGFANMQLSKGSGLAALNVSSYYGVSGSFVDVFHSSLKKEIELSVLDLSLKPTATNIRITGNRVYSSTLLLDDSLMVEGSATNYVPYVFRATNNVVEIGTQSLYEALTGLNLGTYILVDHVSAGTMFMSGTIGGGGSINMVTNMITPSYSKASVVINDTATTGLGGYGSYTANESSTNSNGWYATSSRTWGASFYQNLTNSITLIQEGILLKGPVVYNVTDSLTNAFIINAGLGIYDSIIWRNTDIKVIGNGGAVDITANPQIFLPIQEGQILRIFGTSNTATIKFDDGDGLQLEGGVSFTLGLYDMIEFESRNLAGTIEWIETGRKNN